MDAKAEFKEQVRDTCSKINSWFDEKLQKKLKENESKTVLAEGVLKIVRSEHGLCSKRVKHGKELSEGCMFTIPDDLVEKAVPDSIKDTCRHLQIESVKKHIWNKPTCEMPKKNWKAVYKYSKINENSTAVLHMFYLDELLKLLAFDRTNVEINVELGARYMFQQRPSHALRYFLRAIDGYYNPPLDQESIRDALPYTRPEKLHKILLRAHHCVFEVHLSTGFTKRHSLVRSEEFHQAAIHIRKWLDELGWTMNAMNEIHRTLVLVEEYIGPQSVADDAYVIEHKSLGLLGDLHIELLQKMLGKAKNPVFKKRIREYLGNLYVQSQQYTRAQQTFTEVPDNLVKPLVQTGEKKKLFEQGKDYSFDEHDDIPEHVMRKLRQKKHNERLALCAKPLDKRYVEEKYRADMHHRMHLSSVKSVVDLHPPCRVQLYDPESIEGQHEIKTIIQQTDQNGMGLADVESRVARVGHARYYEKQNSKAYIPHLETSRPPSDLEPDYHFLHEMG